MTPLDVVKCNMQIDSHRYKGVLDGFRVTYREGGMVSFFHDLFGRKVVMADSTRVLLPVCL